MNKKAIVLLVIALFIVFMLGYLFGGQKQPNTANTPSPDGTALSVSVVANHDASAPLYKLSIEYPQFPSAPADFNASIKNFVDSQLTEFKQTIQENWDARQATRPSGTPANVPSQIYYFDVSWEVAQMNPHYISFILRKAAFEGGANENQDIATFDYDLTKKAPVSAADFFPPKTDYLSTVSKLAREQLKNSLESASPGYNAGQMLVDGTTPTADNFKNFTFTDDVVTFYFPKYQVAPGAFGEQRVIFTRTALAQ
jgi:hypothetical protein